MTVDKFVKVYKERDPHQKTLAHRWIRQQYRLWNAGNISCLTRLTRELLGEQTPGDLELFPLDLNA